MENHSRTETAAGRSDAGRSRPPASDPGLRSAAPFGPTLVLVVLGVVGLLLFVAPVTRSLIPFTDLREPFPDQHQDAETLIFVLAFAVLLPAGSLLLPRIADRVAARSGREALSGLTALLAVALIAASLLVRAVGGGLAPAMGAWTAIAAALIAAVASGRIAVPAPVRDGRRALWWLAAVGALALAPSFSDVGSISIAVLFAGVVAAAAIVLIQARISLPPLGRPAGPVADAVLLAVLFLAVPNLVVFNVGDPAAAVETQIIHFHQNFFLGPANQVLGGGAMLVDTLSQYGVGSIYFLVAAFEVLPIGDGTLGLIEGVLSALMFCGAYLVLRIAGVSRLLTAVAMAVAVVVLVYGLVYPLGALLQHGAFRFGLPIGVLLGAVIETRWPRWSTAGRGLQLLTLAVASIWALEGFAYALLTILVVIGVRVWSAPVAERRRIAIRRFAEAAAAIIAAHVAFAAITLAATGEFPRWGWYIETLREFLTGPVGDLTYDFTEWSPGLALGALYLASAAGVILLFRRRRDVIEREPTAIVAIAGSTAMGVALLSYLVNRSADHIVPYVSLPAIMLAALWISLCRRPWLGVEATLSRAALAGGLLVSALMIAVAASSVPTRFEQSALAYARPGGASLRAALDRLRAPPPLSPGAIEGQRLLDRYMPGETHSVVLTDADLSTEILIRSDRASELPLGDPWEDSLVPDIHLDRLGVAVEELGPGTRILVDRPALETFATLRRQPGRDPIDDPVGSASLVPNGLAALQQWALWRIGERYDLKTVARGSTGLRVVELVPRTP